MEFDVGVVCGIVWQGCFALRRVLPLVLVLCGCVFIWAWLTRFERFIGCLSRILLVLVLVVIVCLSGNRCDNGAGSDRYHNIRLYIFKLFRSTIYWISFPQQTPKDIELFL